MLCILGQPDVRTCAKSFITELFFFFRCSRSGLFSVKFSRYCLLTDADLRGGVVRHSPVCLHGSEILFVTSTVVHQWCSGPVALLYLFPHVSPGLLENFGQAKTLLFLEVPRPVLVRKKIGDEKEENF